MHTEELRTRLFDDAMRAVIAELLSSGDKWVRPTGIGILSVAVNHGKPVDLPPRYMLTCVQRTSEQDYLMMLRKLRL